MIKLVNVITDMNIGGAGMVLHNYYKKANRTDFDHTVIVPETSLLAPRLRELDVNVIELPGLSPKSLDIPAIKVFSRKFREIKPDIVHTHASLSARIAARKQKNCAIVHTRHCAYPQAKLKTVFPGKQILGCINNYYSDIIIAISPAACKDLVETGTDAKKIITMFNGVEQLRKISDEDKAAFKKHLGIEEGDFVCAIAARLVPEKGHIYILEAAEKLRDLPIKFVIAGTGPCDEELRAYAESKKLGNCIFTGFLNDVASLVNITDVQLNASYGTEASSISLTEGMSLGVAAVVSDFGGNPYLMTHGKDAIVVPKRNGLAMAEAIRSLYNDPELLKNMGAGALESYVTKYTTEIMAANIEDVYRKAGKLAAGN